MLLQMIGFPFLRLSDIPLYAYTTLFYLIIHQQTHRVFLILFFFRVWEKLTYVTEYGVQHDDLIYIYCVWINLIGSANIQHLIQEQYKEKKEGKRGKKEKIFFCDEDS